MNLSTVSDAGERSVSSQPRILVSSIVMGKHNPEPMQLWSKKF
jgi:hypothetical protein